MFEVSINWTQCRCAYYKQSAELLVTTSQEKAIILNPNLISESEWGCLTEKTWKKVVYGGRE